MYVSGVRTVTGCQSDGRVEPHLHLGPLVLPRPIVTLGYAPFERCITPGPLHRAGPLVNAQTGQGVVGDLANRFYPRGARVASATSGAGRDVKHGVNKLWWN